jgi:hypothetical protein
LLPNARNPTRARFAREIRESNGFFDLVNGIGPVLFRDSEQYFRFRQFAAYDELAVGLLLALYERVLFIIGSSPLDSSQSARSL